MGRRHNVYLVQVNNSYGDNAFLPYSVGLLQTYALTHPVIRESYDFKGFVYLREPILPLIRRLDNPRVFGISCYIWNWSYSMALAKTVKEAFPNCLIVVGGPHVPFRTRGEFFTKYGYVDLLVHHEGELPFAAILLEHLHTHPDYTKINGLTVRTDETKAILTPPGERLDPTVIPSPYLAGIFDELMGEPHAFHASQETHRGCPYSCSFCDWGSAVYTKVRAFSTERLVAEYEWFGKFKIDLLYNCDANYGLLPRDYELTTKLAETKRKYGFPNKFRAAYAKNSNQKVYEIAKVLHSVDMCKGVTLSFQSMNDRVLQAVARKNIRVTEFKEYIKKYQQEGIPTYSELIIGLPEETYDSFTEGINQLIEGGQHDSLQIYNCEVLPNAELNDPQYRAKYGLDTLHVPVLFYHGTPTEDRCTECYELVVGTKSLSREDWVRSHLFAWVIQCFHCLSLTQYFALFCHGQFGISYRLFYEKLLEFGRQNPETLVGKQYQLIEKILRGVFEGKGWQILDERFGNIIWPLEEGSFLKLIAEKENFYQEMGDFLPTFFVDQGRIVDKDLLEDLLQYQKNMIMDPFSPRKFQFSLRFNLHNYFSSLYQREPAALTRLPQTLVVEADREFWGGLEVYAREIVWYGRKGGKFRHTNVTIL